MPFSASTQHAPARLWLADGLAADGLGEWAWPERGSAQRGSAQRGSTRRGARHGARHDDPLGPPAWVPAVPGLRPALSGLHPALAGAAPAGSVSGRQERVPTAWLGLAGLLCALALAWALAAAGGPVAIERLLSPRPHAAAAATAIPVAAADDPPDLLAPLPALDPVSEDAAGSTIEHASYRSGSLGGEGSFFVYLPPGYFHSRARYPVLYLLHGRDGHAEAFLEIGIQHALDSLIGEHAIAPMIAVMVQDLPGIDNWRNIGRRHSETYVVEVQELIDRMLRTVPARYARAIAGSSYGGFGAMNVALANPLRFAVEESWLGFFNNLEGSLHAAAPVIAKLGLHAFLYGAAADPVAMPAEDPEFAAELRAAGAQASSAIYPGGHSLQKTKEHLTTALLFVGRSLRESRARALAEAART